jgi:hypothetical protein
MPNEYQNTPYITLSGGMWYVVDAKTDVVYKTSRLALAEGYFRIYRVRLTNPPLEDESSESYERRIRVMTRAASGKR